MLAGYPVVDVKVTLTFGSYHEVDSNENAFKMAASLGFKDGCRKASPVILEPMMAVEVETPEDYAGNVMGDLSSRRGMVQGMDDIPGGGKAIKAEVPLSEMFGYSTTLALDVARPCHVHDGVQALQPKLRRTWPTRSSRPEGNSNPEGAPAGCPALVSFFVGLHRRSCVASGARIKRAVETLNTTLASLFTLWRN